MFFFNNCHGREHARMYGSGAFYDLNTSGYQATLANHLSVGEQCIVASPSSDGRIDFDWYSFLRETVKPDDTDTPCRVLFGRLISSETLSRADAITDELYSNLFRYQRQL